MVCSRIYERRGSFLHPRAFFNIIYNRQKNHLYLKEKGLRGTRIGLISKESIKAHANVHKATIRLKKKFSRYVTLSQRINDGHDSQDSGNQAGHIDKNLICRGTELVLKGNKQRAPQYPGKGGRRNPVFFGHLGSLTYDHYHPWKKQHHSSSRLASHIC